MLCRSRAVVAVAAVTIKCFCAESRGGIAREREGRERLDSPTLPPSFMSEKNFRLEMESPERKADEHSNSRHRPRNLRNAKKEGA